MTAVDDEQSVLVYEGPPAAPMVVAFGGIRAGIGMPPFEFVRVLEPLETTVVFLRDLDQVWYHRGVRGLSSTLDGTTSALRTLIAAREPRRVVTVGNSAGGFAALLFGFALGVDAVLAFSPQTYLDRWRRLLHVERRWHREIIRLHEARPERPALDLVPELRRAASPPPADVWFDARHRLDRVHGRRLAALPSVRIHPSEGGHEVVKELRDSGELLRVLGTAIEG